MKVIDLLNKIANEEDVPIFKYEDRIYKYNKLHEWFDDIQDDERCKMEFYPSELNDEVEIIEEDKEIEEIKSHYVLGLDESLERVIEWQKENNKIYEDKINELVKAVNELKKGKE